MVVEEFQERHQQLPTLTVGKDVEEVVPNRRFIVRRLMGLAGWITHRKRRSDTEDTFDQLSHHSSGAVLEDSKSGQRSMISASWQK